MEGVKVSYASDQDFVGLNKVLDEYVFVGFEHVLVEPGPVLVAFDL